MSLAIARKIAGLTQVELAQKAGINSEVLSRIENGHRTLPSSQYAMVKRLADALGILPHELVQIARLVQPFEVPGEDRAQTPREYWRRQRRKRKRAQQQPDGPAPGS